MNLTCPVLGNSVETLDGDLGEDVEDDVELHGVASVLANIAEAHAKQAEAEKKLTKKKDQELALKKLSNVARYKLNMNCINDQFRSGRKELKNVVEDRRKELAKEERKHNIIYQSVAHYKRCMEVTMAELDDIIKSVELKQRRKLSDWEIENDNEIKAFDVEEFMRQEAADLP